MTASLSTELKENMLAHIPLKRFGEPRTSRAAVRFLASEESRLHYGARARRQRRNVHGDLWRTPLVRAASHFVNALRAKSVAKSGDTARQECVRHASDRTCSARRNSPSTSALSPRMHGAVRTPALQHPFTGESVEKLRSPAHRRPDATWAPAESYPTYKRERAISAATGANAPSCVRMPGSIGARLARAPAVLLVDQHVFSQQP